MDRVLAAAGQRARACVENFCCPVTAAAAPLCACAVHLWPVSSRQGCSLQSLHPGLFTVSR